MAVNNTSMSKYAPRATGIRDPRDATKKNGMFWNPVRYLYLGGAPQAFTQAGSKKPAGVGEHPQNAVGPISDRGRGRG